VRGNHEGRRARRRSAGGSVQPSVQSGAGASSCDQSRGPLEPGGPEGPFGPKAPCRWRGASARRSDCGGEPPRSFAPAVRAAQARRPLRPEAPCLAECDSQRFRQQRRTSTAFGAGRPSDATRRSRCPEAPCRRPGAPARTALAGASSHLLGAGRPSGFGPKAAVLGSTLPWPGVSSGTGTAGANSHSRWRQPSGLGCHK